ncbi:hypothetical protein KC316_g13550 [Hortaea werneckii]|uniref:PAC domain-containing protein n=1 Tax=Hortaea werneckii TaxID=91943 RepID=A0A3M6YPX7_HORWE|nr:hypothetical protein KC316_g13550 [Hortaea werneckii]RMY05100.1 hypothetical protein D0868_06591 [Hortaea werneckii]
MDAPDVPRSRAGSASSKSKKLSSTLTSFIKYPHHASNGKRELKAEKDRSSSRPGTASSSNLRGARAPSSAETTIPIPPDTRNAGLSQSSSSEALNEPLVEDFQDRYSSKQVFEQGRGTDNIFTHSNRSSAQAVKSPPDAPDFDGFDESTPHAMGHPEPPKPAMAGSSRTGRDNREASRSGQAASYPTSSPETPNEGPRRDGNAYERSSGEADSVFSADTQATSVHTLPPLQSKGPDNSDAQQLEPIGEDDPRSFDLVAPAEEGAATGMYAMEKRSEQLFSNQHLREIFEDPKLLLRFTGYLNVHRPQSIPLLIYYLDALKALRALTYANAVAEALEPIKGLEFTDDDAQPSVNQKLEGKASKAFDILVREDLPAYITHRWVQVVSLSIQKRITGTLAPHLREASEGLAEVFCLTDPSRPDNPIVFASEEFARTTQYGMGYTIGRNCRFLQGPRTDPNSPRRLAQACQAGREHSEVLLNYRRDGSPFMNLLMIAPLMDSRGNIRYYIGAQVDVSGLIKDCTDLVGLERMVEREEDPEAAAEEDEQNKKDEFQNLSEMFNSAELDTVRKYGGRMHKEYADDSDAESTTQSRRRVLLKDPSQDALDDRAESLASFGAPQAKEKLNGRLEGVYQHYLLVRPAPSLRILFTSPSLRVPGILQSPFLNRIGGSSRVRTDLEAALGEGRGVTAKIRWLTKADENGEGEGRPRWIHCTPLLGHSGAVGVWMVVLVDEEGSSVLSTTGRRFRPAPPVSSNIGGKEWDGSHHKPNDRRQLNAYDAESGRRPAQRNPERERDLGYYNPPGAQRPSNSRKNSGPATGGTYMNYQSSRPTSRPRGANDAESVAGASEFSFNIEKTPTKRDDPRKGMVY